MYCTVPVVVGFGDEGVNIVVTEVTPMRDHFEVESGYVVEPGYDFSEVYNAHYKEVQAKLKEWWKEGSDDEI